MKTYHKRLPSLGIPAITLAIFGGSGPLAAASDPIPAVYPVVQENGKYYYENVLADEKYPLEPASERYAPGSLIGNPTGSKTGIQFEFSDIAGSFSVENGRLYMGLIPFGDGIYPQPVLDNAYAPIGTPAKCRHPVADFSLLKFTNDPTDPSNNFDLTRWEEAGNGTVGYRVVNGDGVILYDGKVGFLAEKKGDKAFDFVVNKASIVTGPFVHYQEDGTYHDGIRVSFDTLHPTTAVVTLYDGYGTALGEIESTAVGKTHEVAIDGLEPNTEYHYSIETSTKDGHSYFERRFDSLTEPFLYSFQTAPAPGSRLPLAFGFTSDGRTGSKGGGMGERFLGGAINGYLLKKIASLAEQKEVSFVQFTGDLISGYDTSTPEHVAELLVWKNTIQPFASHTPWMVGMGNHEASLFDSFKGPIDIQVDKFPFETRSAETVFSRQFVNPTNGPESEDGQYYDLDPSTKNFPDYHETAFHYSYDNVAVVSLNSDYWYSPNLDSVKYPFYVGGLHGYVMDGQLQWMRETLAAYETDENIDHVFVTIHTPAFPNSGHIEDDMWYNGDNRQRPVVLDENGKNLIEKGIIERRDEFLLAMMKTEKVRMLLAGDEHNFCYTIIDGETEIYPKDWNGEDIRNHPDFRPLIEMTNGAAGAPYYGQGEVPWTPKVPFFTTRNALSLFYVDGESIDIEVINPDTLEVLIEVGEIEID